MPLSWSEITAKLDPAGFTIDSVRARLRAVGDGGGYIVCASQEFIDDIPTENILAMYDEVARG